MSDANREPHPGQVFLSPRQVCQRYSIHRATVYRWIETRGFPAPVTFSSSCARFPLAEIEAWETAQMAKRGTA